MKIKIGTIVESEFGQGPVVAITDEWVVHRCPDGHEAALPRGAGEFWIPVTEYDENGTLHESADEVEDEQMW